MFNLILDFVFPKTCVVCQKMDTFLCSGCKKEMDFATQICPVCGEESLMGWVHDRCREKWGMDGLIALYEYKNPVVQKIVEGIKFGFNRELIGMVLDGFSFELGESFDLVIPVPLYFYRKNWRGFNQAEEIAKEISTKINIETVNVLQRTRMTKQQSKMKTTKEREDNIRNAFVVSRERQAILKDKKVLLIDDVFTSGADMRECTKVLKKGGAAVVWGLSLAH